MDRQMTKQIITLSGRVVCKDCVNGEVCRRCDGMLHPDDMSNAEEYDGCIKCGAYWC